jgi:hypothetical protein
MEIIMQVVAVEAHGALGAQLAPEEMAVAEVVAQIILVQQQEHLTLAVEVEVQVPHHRLQFHKAAVLGL